MEIERDAARKLIGFFCFERSSFMIAVEATYEKGAIKLGRHPDVDRCSVIVIFEIEKGINDESHEWLDAQNSRLTGIWDNDEHSVYDKV